MKLNRDELRVLVHPPEPTTGMLTGRVPAGIRIEHILTGCAVECVKYRSQHKNKEAALMVLELLVESVEKGE